MRCKKHKQQFYTAFFDRQWSVENMNYRLSYVMRINPLFFLGKTELLFPKRDALH